MTGRPRRTPAGGTWRSIGLIRMAADALRQHRAGYLDEAASLLKPPPGTAG
ncbi:hypothetical protein [Streptosporangium canum]|uniref:hypothetical protein n=1 Tax=Streptosporangium canum TaxID=324952 RepID=UPI0037A89FC0